MARSRLIYFTTLGIASFAVANFLARPASMLTWQKGSDSMAEIGAPPPRPGHEVALVYIGSPNCAWSNVPELPRLIEEATLRGREQAMQLGIGFASIGVGKSNSVDAGIKHLARIGDFDELITGRGWYGIGTRRYVSQDLGGPAATPQVVLVAREILPGNERAIVGERVLARYIGVDPIRKWVETGARIPKSD